MANNPNKLATVLIFCLISGSVVADAVPGGVYAWSMPPGAEQVRFQDRPVMVVNNTALVGIPIKQTPGPALVTYRQQQQARSHTFEVTAKQYSEQHITIQNRNLVNPPSQDRERISREAQQQRRLYNQHSAALVLADGFILPLEGITTSLYGHRRFFNGQPRNPHSGLDIAAPSGTPIVAAGPAVVTLAEDLFFNGNTVFLDHGQGLVTMYCHMSEISVEVGSAVARGETIGLVGATGRATGPHLHWSVSLNGYRVDPTDFMQSLKMAIDSGKKSK